MGTDDPDKGFVSMLFLPQPQASALERDAKNNALSLRLLASQYSANAYAFSTLYQNCNQWLAELLAVSFPACPPMNTCAPVPKPGSQSKGTPPPP